MPLMMISLDAVDSSDTQALLSMPNFSRLCARGTLVRKAESVFVSNTYPAHTSIVTGCHPGRHGITGNLYTAPSEPHPGWRTLSSEIKVPTLYQKAAQAGLTVCSILYPVTEGANEIRWNIPEIPGRMNPFTRVSRMFRGGSPLFILRSVLAGLPGLRGANVASLDNLTTRALCTALRTHRPDLSLLHLIDVDDTKHHHGPGGKDALAALRRHDERLGLIISAADSAFGEYGWSMIVFSDHGCLPVERAEEPNDFLRGKGLIFKQGRHEQFDAFFDNAGGSTFLKVLNTGRLDEITRFADEFEKLPFVGRRLEAAELERAGLGGEFLCGFEAAEGVCFGAKELGQHGYSLRHKDYQAFYAAVGDGIPANEEQQGGCIVDICPLAARLLGLAEWETDGCDRLKEQTDIEI